MSKEEVAGRGGRRLLALGHSIYGMVQISYPPQSASKNRYQVKHVELGSNTAIWPTVSRFFLWVLIWLRRDRYLDNALIVIRRACERQRRSLVKWD